MLQLPWGDSYSTFGFLGGEKNDILIFSPPKKPKAPKWHLRVVTMDQYKKEFFDFHLLYMMKEGFITSFLNSN